MSKTPSKHSVNDFFGLVAQTASQKLGHAGSFIIACTVVIIWAICGPLFKYSDTWQLVINTGTTIVTFLMVFLIQNTQNRDMAALHLKLDELIRVNADARDKLLNLEDMTEEELTNMKGYFKGIASQSDATGQQFSEIQENLADAKEDISKAEEKIATKTRDADQ